MAGNSGSDPNHPPAAGDDGLSAARKPAANWNPTGYGGVNGSNAWMTAAQAISTGESDGLTGGLYLKR